MSRDPNQYPVSYQSTPISGSSPAEHINTAVLPVSPYTERPPIEMATLPPPSHMAQPDPYRHHGGYSMHSPLAHSFPPSQQSPASPSQHPPTFPPQPAPRQRTAIACKYCRRRKIRCHGFDSSPDARCTNCLRFNQECIFTPVSTQGHAFVPAHTVYPHLRNTRGIQAGPDGRPLPYAGQPGPPLYGAHGQPLGPVGQPDSSYTTLSPQAGYAPGPYSAQTPTLPPPPSVMHYEDRPLQAQDHRRGSSGYEYPDPTHMAPASPASSTTSYQSPAYVPSGAQPYYQTTPADRRTSPTTSYFGSRSTGSSHGSNGTTVLPPLPTDLHPPQSLPPGFDGYDPSPRAVSPRTAAMRVAASLPPTGTRSSTDSDMLNALNRHRR